MFKKLTMLAMAVGALIAFAAPASAFATVSGNVEPGDMFTARSVDLVTSSGAAKLECGTVTIEGEWGEDTSEVETLDGTVTNVDAHDAGVTPCSTNNPNIKADISNVSVTNLSLGATEGSADATFVATITAPGPTVLGTCHYQGEITFAYNHNTALSLEVTGSEQLTQTAPKCPTAAEGGKATMAGKFAVTKGTNTTGGGEPVEITTP